jgi:hypothetical protein
MVLRRIAFLALVVFVLGTAPEARAETFLGDFCWQINFQGSPGTGLLKLGVYEKEGGHFALYGTIFDGSATTPINGNAEIIDGQVLLTGLDSIFTSPDIFSNVSNAALDLSTLNGSFSRMILEVDTAQTTFDVLFILGTLTLISCP